MKTTTIQPERSARPHRGPPVGARLGPPAPPAREKEAFTLIELLVVISIISLLVTIMVPALGKARELARRAICANNQAAIGKGLALYASANGDNYPWVQASASWSAATGQNRATAPSAGANYSVSALLFVLVRDGQAAGLFICPSTLDKADPNTRSDTAWYWDFSPYSVGGTEHLSYSYQSPLNVSTTGTPAYASGVGPASDALLAVLSERTPAYAGGAVGDTVRRADFPWDNPGDSDPRAGMSPNHTDGEYANVLYADGHVANTNRADIGVNNDNIYSSAIGARDVQRGAGSLVLADHDSAKDSFLTGPVRYNP